MTKKVLCYTVAFDLNGASVFRQQARMLVASLLRSGFEGDIKVFHNNEFEIFDHPRINLEEIRIDSPKSGKECLMAKYQVRHLLQVEDYDWVAFFDVDCIVNAPLDEWFEGPEIIRYVQETRLRIQLAQFNGYLSEEEMENLNATGYNSGNFVIKADHFHEIAAKWEAIDQSPALRDKPCWEQSSWNRLLLDTKLSTKPLANPSVDFFYDKRDFMELLKSPVLHFCGCDSVERMLAMQAKFLSNFHTNVDGTLIGMLER